MSQHLGTLLVLLLLVVPLLAGSHNHSGSPASDNCPVCVIVTHAPAVSAAPIPNLTPDLTAQALVFAPVSVPVRVALAAGCSRAPPSLSLPIA